jgi:hypothetical protein
MYAEFAHAVESRIDQNYSCFLEGPVGSGKSEALIGRLRFLLDSGVPGYSILVLLPDRATRTRFSEELARADLGPYGAVDLHTYYSLACRLVRLFWPLVAAGAGFAAPQRPPVFLNYETAQYLMSQLLAPLLAQGYFEGLAMRPQRVLSQLLDNLNKAAVNGYPIAEIEGRLQEAWTGEETRLRYYAQTQQCIELFRGHALQHGLLDFSLVVEVFHHHLVEKAAFWRYFTERFRHILVDQLDESLPVAQDLVGRLLPLCDSGTLAWDQGGGFRVFLGADVTGAAQLRHACKENIRAAAGERASPHIEAFGARIGKCLGQEVEIPPTGEPLRAVAALIQTRYRAQMIEEVARKILALVESGVAPGEIAVVAPYTDGVLRFMLSEAFKVADIPFAIVRRFESLREEPVARACLTLVALAHPAWGLRPQTYDVGEALELALAPLDPVRAALAARHLYGLKEGCLVPREKLSADIQERMGGAVLERYEELREWLETYRQGEPIAFDHFLRRLFGEILSTPDLSPEDAAVYSKLIASATSFRQAGPAMGLDGKDLGRRYVEMVLMGVVAAQHLADQDVEVAPESITLVAPVYTYLLSHRVVRFQFWLDIGAMGWWEPVHQPLTNHHVLSRRWQRGARWTDAVDFKIRNQILFRLVQGLGRRCSEGIYLCNSDLEGRGELQDSPLLQAVQQVLQEAL